MSSLSTVNTKMHLPDVITVKKVELQKHDVLCGRGTGPNEYCGNKNFLKLVAERRNEYIGTSNRSKKAQIAKEIIDQVRNLSPPGRFLERVKSTSSKKINSLEVWMVVLDEKKCLEKAKQALRETWHRKSKEVNPLNITSDRKTLKPKNDHDNPRKRKDHPNCEERVKERNISKKRETFKQVSSSLSLARNNNAEGMLRIYQEVKSALAADKPRIESSNQGDSYSMTSCISNDSCIENSANHVGGKLRFF